MRSSLRSRRALTVAVTVAGLALPASALPAGALAASARPARSTGTVLSVDRAHRVVQVVDAGHAVHAYRYRQLTRVTTGSRIRFTISGPRITSVTVLGKATRVSFTAKVVRSQAHKLVLRLADGQHVTFGDRQLTSTAVSAPSVRNALRGATRMAAHGLLTINVNGLQPGETVLITESIGGQGNLTITIELTGTPSGGTVSEQQATGVVTDVGSDTFEVAATDGSTLKFHMAEDALANANLSYCDQVSVSYHEDAGLLIADSAQDGGPSTSGVCGGDSGGSDPGSDQDAIGTITSVSGTEVTIDEGAGQGPVNFAVDDPSITDGFNVGDVVDVTYSQLSDGSLDASDVEYVEDDVTGVVTAVSGGSITITDDVTGNPETFSADPSAGMFDGIQIGDDVDVTYHVSAGGDVVDNVTAGGGS